MKILLKFIKINFDDAGHTLMMPWKYFDNVCENTFVWWGKSYENTFV